MQLTESQHDDIVVLAPNGRLDASTSRPLEDRVVALISSGAKRLVIDLAQTTYISSAGLRVLLIAAKRLADTGKVILAAPQPPVREVFDIAGFPAIFQIYDTQQEALAAAR